MDHELDQKALEHFNKILLSIPEHIKKLSSTLLDFNQVYQSPLHKNIQFIRDGTQIIFESLKDNITNVENMYQVFLQSIMIYMNLQYDEWITYVQTLQSEMSKCAQHPKYLAIELTKLENKLTQLYEQVEENTKQINSYMPAGLVTNAMNRVRAVRNQFTQPSSIDTSKNSEERNIANAHQEEFLRLLNESKIFLGILISATKEFHHGMKECESFFNTYSYILNEISRTKSDDVKDVRDVRAINHFNIVKDFSRTFMESCSIFLGSVADITSDLGALHELSKLSSFDSLNMQALPQHVQKFVKAIKVLCEVYDQVQQMPFDLLQSEIDGMKPISAQLVDAMNAFFREILPTYNRNSC